MQYGVDSHSLLFRNTTPYTFAQAIIIRKLHLHIRRAPVHVLRRGEFYWWQSLGVQINYTQYYHLRQGNESQPRESNV